MIIHTCVICKKINSSDMIEFVKELDTPKKYPVCFDCREDAKKKKTIGVG